MLASLGDWLPGWDWLYNAITGIGQTIYCAVVRSWCWLLQFLLDLAMAPFELVVPLCPAALKGAIAEIAGFYDEINAIVPLDTVETVFGLWWLFIVPFIALRWVLSFIPGLGGR